MVRLSLTGKKIGLYYYVEAEYDTLSVKIIHFLFGYIVNKLYISYVVER